MKRLGYFAVSIFMILILAACERESSEIANDSRKMELLLGNKMELLKDDNGFSTDFKSNEKFLSFLRDSVLKLNLIVEDVPIESDLYGYWDFGVGNNDVTNHSNTVLKMEIIFWGNRSVMCWNRG